LNGNKKVIGNYAAKITRFQIVIKRCGIKTQHPNICSGTKKSKRWLPEYSRSAIPAMRRIFSVCFYRGITAGQVHEKNKQSDYLKNPVFHTLKINKNFDFL